MGILARARVVLGLERREVIIEVADVHPAQAMTMIVEVILKAKTILCGLAVKIALLVQTGEGRTVQSR